MLRTVLISVFSLFLFLDTISQQATIIGLVQDEKLAPIFSATIQIKDLQITTITDNDGKFTLTVPSEVDLEIEISFLGYKTQIIREKLKNKSTVKKNIFLELDYTILPDTEITDKFERFEPIVRMDPTISLKLPTVGGFEDILKSLPQVSSTNELTSQYNVRGGNFDENMVFVNDIEIYRPLLTRSGNQEGMSFINPEMVSGVTFSAGGFDAKYGDKMSSVLDVKYKKPYKFAASAYISLLGAGFQVEGTNKNKRFKFNTGLRYKTTRYLLTTMDMNGSYDPNFVDFQTYMTYDVNEKIELALLTNISNNSYNFIPTDMKTSFGTYQEMMGVNMYFEGQEIDLFTNATLAFASTWKISNRMKAKFILSGYHTAEKESFDILTEYYLNEINRDINSNTSGDSVVNIGIGSLLDHARNNLNANILSLKYIGTYDISNHNIEWGLQYNYETMNYKINEWKMIDSAGYSLPRDENNVYLSFVDNDNVLINQSRIVAYLQDSYVFNFKKGDLFINGGVRFNYLSFNNEFLVSPRFNIAFNPEKKKNLVLRFSTGLYHQPPSFKEIRNLDGKINYDIKAQSSLHLVFATILDFKLWDRRFKFTGDIFYKYLYNLNPYTVDNIKIIYYGDNISHGYATGIEAKINGEFVKNTDSWFSIAIMNTREIIDGKYHIIYNDEHNIKDTSWGYFPRPSDQLLNIGIFFQDYIPRNPTWQVYLSFLYGTGLPTTKLNKEERISYSRLPSYRRVDIGISKQFITQYRKLPKGNIFRNFKELWVSLEVFNLLDINNTISWTFIQATNGYMYGVPNYLTRRRINLKIITKF